MKPTTPADMITVSRIVMAPVVLIAAALSRGTIEPFWPMLAFVVFVIGALSDLVDGIVARFTGTSAWGARWDPIADKILVWAALIGIVIAGGLGGWHLIPVIVLIARDVLVDLARQKRSIPVNWMGKTKTFLAMLAIILLLASPAITYTLIWNPGGYGLWMFPNAGLLWVGTGILWLAALLSVISALGYLSKPNQAVPA